MAVTISAVQVAPPQKKASLLNRLFPYRQRGWKAGYLDGWKQAEADFSWSAFHPESVVLEAQVGEMLAARLEGLAKECRSDFESLRSRLHR